MGSYTGFNFHAEIPDAQAEQHPGLIPLLRAMVDGTVDHRPRPEIGYVTPEDAPNREHPLFATARWGHMLIGSSYYFVTGRTTLVHDDIGRAHYLVVSSSFKNYDDEIGRFLDWIGPYINPSEVFYGWEMSEYCDIPSLIYRINGRWIREEPPFPKEPRNTDVFEGTVLTDATPEQVTRAIAGRGPAAGGGRFA